MKEILIQKLTSRKFWAAVSVMVTGIVMLFGYAETTAETIGGIVLTLGGAIGYMVAEGFVDAKNVGKVVEGVGTIIQELKDKSTEETKEVKEDVTENE